MEEDVLKGSVLSELKEREVGGFDGCDPAEGEKKSKRYRQTEVKRLRGQVLRDCIRTHSSYLNQNS